MGGGRFEISILWWSGLTAACSASTFLFLAPPAPRRDGGGGWWGPPGESGNGSVGARRPPRARAYRLPCVTDGGAGRRRGPRDGGVVVGRMGGDGGRLGGEVLGFGFEGGDERANAKLERGAAK
jgi:hypothetical protein